MVCKAGPALKEAHQITHDVCNTGKKHGVKAETNQTLFVSWLAGVADIDPQGLLPQCTVGDLHAEHLVELHDVLRRWAACSEEAAGGLHAGQHRHAHMPVGGEDEGHTMQSMELQTAR